MKSISAILIYFGLQAIAGALFPANIFLALLLSTLLSITLFFCFRYISLKDYAKPEKAGSIILFAITFLLPSLALQELLNIDSSNLDALFCQIFNSPLIAALCIGVAVPVAEEMMFRGMIQTQLQNVLPLRYAIILSAALFAIFHLELAQMPHAFIVGLLLAWLRHRYSLTASTLFHITNNSAVFAMTMILGDDDVSIPDLFGGNMLLLALSICLATALSVWAFYRLYHTC